MLRSCRVRPGPGRHSGFTLPELLVAVAVFGLITAAAYGALDGLSRSAGELEQRRAALEELHWAVTLLDRDLRQGLEFQTDTDGALTLNLVSLPVAGPGTGAAQPSATIWQSQPDDDLRRWPRNQPDQQRRFEGIQLVDIQWLDRQGRRLPDYQAGRITAVAYRLESEVFGSIERLVEVAGAG